LKKFVPLVGVSRRCRNDDILFLFNFIYILWILAKFESRLFSRKYEFIKLLTIISVQFFPPYLKKLDYLPFISLWQVSFNQIQFFLKTFDQSVDFKAKY
jgi:hypothetical protein